MLPTAGRPEVGESRVNEPQRPCPVNDQLLPVDRLTTGGQRWERRATSQGGDGPSEPLGVAPDLWILACLVQSPDGRLGMENDVGSIKQGLDSLVQLLHSRGTGPPSVARSSHTSRVCCRMTGWRRIPRGMDREVFVRPSSKAVSRGKTISSTRRADRRFRWCLRSSLLSRLDCSRTPPARSEAQSQGESQDQAQQRGAETLLGPAELPSLRMGAGTAGKPRCLVASPEG